MRHSYGVKELLLEVCKALLGDSVQLTAELDLEKASIDKVSSQAILQVTLNSGALVRELTRSHSCLLYVHQQIDEEQLEKLYSEYEKASN